MLVTAGCGGKDAVDTNPADQVQGPAGTLHVDDGGTGGVPVVFVHGYGGNSEQWSAQLAHTSHENTPNDLQNLVPGLPHRGIEQASHWMHMDKPEEFNGLLSEFLATIT